MEGELLVAADLGRGWHEVDMVNNAERLDPLGDDEDSAVVRAARAARRLTALDEGRAWRRRRDGALAVLRVEVFAAADDGAHRAAWRAHAERSLDATWRQRWQERGERPGWIESRWVEEGDRGDGGAHDAAGLGAVDALRVEDHTDPSGRGTVTVYEHRTVWAGRLHATLTLRHDLTAEVPVDAGARALQRRLAEVGGPAGGPSPP